MQTKIETRLPGIQAHDALNLERIKVDALTRQAEEDERLGGARQKIATIPSENQPKPVRNTEQVEFAGKLHYCGKLKLGDGEDYDVWSPIPPSSPETGALLQRPFEQFVRDGTSAAPPPSAKPSFKEFSIIANTVQRLAEEKKQLQDALEQLQCERMEEMERELKPQGGSPEYLKLLDEMADLHRRKNAGYAGGKTDPWDNFRECEDFGVDAFTGVFVRMSDKWKRLKSLKRNPNNEQVGESMGDTLMDLAAYALIAKCLLDEQE